MKHTSLSLALGLSYGLLGAAAIAGAAITSSLFGNASWALLRPAGAADLKTMPGGAAQVLHVTVHHPATPYYQIQLTHDIAASVPAGTSLRYQFWARSATHNSIHAVVEKRTAPYTRILDKPITLTPAWKEYTFTAPVPMAYGPKGLAARLQLGQRAGVMDFKGLTMTSASR